MCELTQAPAECIVLGVIIWVGKVVATGDLGSAVVGIGFVGEKVDFPEELLFVVLEFADHAGIQGAWNTLLR